MGSAQSRQFRLDAKSKKSKGKAAVYGSYATAANTLGSTSKADWGG